MTRAILLALSLTLVCAISVTLDVPETEAQRKPKRDVEKLKEFRAIIFNKDAAPADRIKAVKDMPKVTSAPVARGLGEIYLEIVTKDGPSDLTNALRDTLRGITHEETLVGLRDDVRDAANVDHDLRADWLRANMSLTTPDCDEFLVECADDMIPTIRMYAIEALGARGVAKGFEPVTAHLNDTGSWRVKGAAIQAVVGYVKHDPARYRTGSIHALMDALNREMGGLQLDLMIALKAVSGRDFGTDRDAWWSWYRDFRKGDGAEGEPKENKPPRSRPVFGVDLFSRQMIFVLDTSVSMREEIEKEEVERIRRPITGKEREAEDEEKDPDINWDDVKTRLDLARAELIRTVRRLHHDAYFTIITYSTEVLVWKPTLVKADKKTKDEAIAMLKTLKTDKLTNIYGALDTAIEIAENAIKAAEEAAEKARNKRPSKTGAKKSDSREQEPEALAPDTIYFLSDGFATTGEYKGPDVAGQATPEQAAKYDEAMAAMLAKIVERNEKLRMRVNVIGVGKDHDNRTLKKLAAQNRGTYVAIGDPRFKKKQDIK
jgi:hypothetical protein